MPVVSGTVIDINTNGVSRKVRVHRRDTGEVLGEMFSDPASGNYSITVAYTGEVQVILQDDDAGSIENDQILRTTPV